MTYTVPDHTDYTCRVCQRRYRRYAYVNGVSCTVLHRPGSCCHYLEVELMDFKSRTATNAPTSVRL